MHPGQRVQVTATAYPDRRFTAQVDRISDRVDPDTRTLKVRLLVSNPGLLLKPEMFINASVVVSETTAGVTVPSAARVFTKATAATCLWRSASAGSSAAKCVPRRPEKGVCE